MPGTNRLDINDETQIEAAGHEISDRMAMIEENRRYYNGDMDKPLKVEPDQADNNIIVNMCGDMVDQTITFLAAHMPTLEMDDVRDMSEDEQFIRAMWEANGGAELLSNIALNGALSGQNYVKVKAADPAVTGHEYPQIVNLKPDYWVTWWDADNYRREWGFEARWPVAKKKAVSKMTSSTNEQQWNRQVVVYDGERWRVLDFVGAKKKWQLVGEDVWGYEHPPVVSVSHMPKPNSYYGKHELLHKRLNDALNAVASDIKAILHWHADPTMFGKGFLADALQPTAVDGLWTVENSDADLKTVEMMSDLSPSMNFFLKLESLFARQSRVVQMPSDLSMFRSVTNLGIKAMFMPQLVKNTLLQRSYGQLIDRVTRVALMISGMDYEGVRVKPVWKTPLPVDDVTEVQTLQNEMAMGILSKRQAAEARGRDYDQVQADIIDEDMMDGVLRGGEQIGVSG